MSTSYLDFGEGRVLRNWIGIVSRLLESPSEKGGPRLSTAWGSGHTLRWFWPSKSYSLAQERGLQDGVKWIDPTWRAATSENGRDRGFASNLEVAASSVGLMRIGSATARSPGWRPREVQRPTDRTSFSGRYSTANDLATLIEVARGGPEVPSRRRHERRRAPWSPRHRCGPPAKSPARVAEWSNRRFHEKARIRRSGRCGGLGEGLSGMTRPNAEIFGCRLSTKRVGREGPPGKSQGIAQRKPPWDLPP